MTMPTAEESAQVEHDLLQTRLAVSYLLEKARRELSGPAFGVVDYAKAQYLVDWLEDEFAAIPEPVLP